MRSPQEPLFLTSIEGLIETRKRFRGTRTTLVSAASAHNLILDDFKFSDKNINSSRAETWFIIPCDVYVRLFPYLQNHAREDVLTTHVFPLRVFECVVTPCRCNRMLARTVSTRRSSLPTANGRTKSLPTPPATTSSIFFSASVSSEWRGYAMLLLELHANLHC